LRQFAIEFHQLAFVFLGYELAQPHILILFTRTIIPSDAHQSLRANVSTSNRG